MPPNTRATVKPGAAAMVIRPKNPFPNRHLLPMMPPVSAAFRNTIEVSDHEGVNNAAEAIVPAAQYTKHHILPNFLVRRAKKGYKRRLNDDQAHYFKYILGSGNILYDIGKQTTRQYADSQPKQHPRYATMQP